MASISRLINKTTMIEINIKRYENGKQTSIANKDVEVSDLYNFMYYEMKDFALLKEAYKRFAADYEPQQKLF